MLCPPVLELKTTKSTAVYTGTLIEDKKNYTVLLFTLVLELKKRNNNSALLSTLILELRTKNKNNSVLMCTPDL